MFTFFIIVCIFVMIAGMAVVAVTVNEFAKNLEEFRTVLETRYALEPITSAKKKAKENMKSATSASNALDTLLKKTDEAAKKVLPPQ